jgi:hypothetical protein
MTRMSRHRASFIGSEPQRGFHRGPGVGSLTADLIPTGATNLPLATFETGRFAASAYFAVSIVKP